jgi:hypothetical protein
MLNPYLTPPSRGWPAWLRTLLVLIALGWLGAMLWHILQVRAGDEVLAATAQGTFVAETKVAAALWAIAIVAYLIAISAALGLDLLVRNFKGTVAPIVAFPVHVALGMAVFSALFFLLGLAHGGYGLWPLILVLLAGGINILRWHRHRPVGTGEVFENPPETSLWFFLIIALAMIAAAGALAPPTAHDDLVYHLESPSHMLEVGHRDAPAWNLYAHWPNLLHSLYVPMLALDPWEAAPRLLTVFLGVMICYCLYRIGGFWFSPRAGGVAGILFLTTPVALGSWSVAGLDMAGAFFITVSMLVLVIAPMERAHAHARLAGFLAGCALACRLSAISAIVGLIVLIVGRWWRYRADVRDTIGLERPALFRMLLAFLWPIAIIHVPFVLHAWCTTGNPIYPFIFGGLAWTPELARGAAQWNMEMGMGDRTLGDFVMLPWRLVSRAGGGSYERFAGVLQPWLLLLAPLALGAPRFMRKCVLLGGMLAAGGAVWFLTSQQARFLLPLVPWVALIGGVGFDAFVRGFPKRTRPWISGALGLLMAGTGVFLVPSMDLLNFSENTQVALTQRETREDYLRRNLEIYPAVEWLNSRAALEVHGVLLLWDNRGHHLEVPWSADPILEVPATFLARWRDRTPDEIAEGLLTGRWGDEMPGEGGISHIVVNTHSREHIFEHRGFAIDRATHDAIWQPLAESHLDLVHTVGPYEIYQLRPPGGP